MMEIRISDMMDNIQDDTVQLHIQSIVSTDKIKEIVMKKLHSDTASQKQARKTMSRRSLVAIAAVVIFTILLVPTALAYGGEIVGAIKQFMFSGSNASQVESINHAGSINGINGHGDNFGGIGFEIKNRSAFASGVINGLDSDEVIDDGFIVDDGVTRFTVNNCTIFDTFEEAQAAAPFEIRLPGHLPTSASLHSILVTHFQDGAYAYEAHIDYTLDLGADGFYSFTLNEYYVGPDAYIDLSTEYPIEKIMVGRAETAYVHETETNNQWLYWIKDDVLYSIYSNGSYTDMETLLKIAESI